MKWLVVLFRLNFFLCHSPVKETSFCGRENMSVSFRVKDQCQAASHCPMYSGVAEAEVQPSVGVRGGVTGRCDPLSLWPPFGKSAQQLHC